MAFTAYMYANSTLSNHTVATYAYVNPVIAVVLGVALGDETVGANVYLGGAIIMSAVVLIVTGRSSDRRTEPKAEPDPADRRAGPEPRPGAVARGPASSARPSAGPPGHRGPLTPPPGGMRGAPGSGRERWGGAARGRRQGRRQSTGAAPWRARWSLARLKGREPKNPRSAERGEGWADSITG